MGAQNSVVQETKEYPTTSHTRQNVHIDFKKPQQFIQCIFERKMGDKCEMAEYIKHLITSSSKTNSDNQSASFELLYELVYKNRFDLHMYIPDFLRGDVPAYAIEDFIRIHMKKGCVSEFDIDQIEMQILELMFELDRKYGDVSKHKEKYFQALLLCFLSGDIEKAWKIKKLYRADWEVTEYLCFLLDAIIGKIKRKDIRNIDDFIIEQFQYIIDKLIYLKEEKLISLIKLIAFILLDNKSEVIKLIIDDDDVFGLDMEDRIKIILKLKKENYWDRNLYEDNELMRKFLIKHAKNKGSVDKMAEFEYLMKAELFVVDDLERAVVIAISQILPYYTDYSDIEDIWQELLNSINYMDDYESVGIQVATIMEEKLYLLHAAAIYRSLGHSEESKRLNKEYDEMMDIFIIR